MHDRKFLIRLDLFKATQTATQAAETLTEEHQEETALAQSSMTTRSGGADADLSQTVCLGSTPVGSEPAGLTRSPLMNSGCK